MVARPPRTMGIRPRGMDKVVKLHLVVLILQLARVPGVVIQAVHPMLGTPRLGMAQVVRPVVDQIARRRGVDKALLGPRVMGRVVRRSMAVMETGTHPLVPMTGTHQREAMAATLPQATVLEATTAVATVEAMMMMMVGPILRRTIDEPTTLSAPNQHPSPSPAPPSKHAKRTRSKSKPNSFRSPPCTLHLPVTTKLSLKPIQRTYPPTPTWLLSRPWWSYPALPFRGKRLCKLVPKPSLRPLL